MNRQKAGVSPAFSFIIARLERILKRQPAVETGDVRDPAALRWVFAHHRFGALAHLTGRKTVAESVRDPLLYNGVNFGGTVPPCGVIAEFGVRRLPFSSSATVPGAPLDDMMAGVWCWQQRQGDEELRCHE